MPHTLSVTLSDPAFDGLRRAAESAGTDPAVWLAGAVADLFPTPGQGDIRKFFGAVSLPPDGDHGLSACEPCDTRRLFGTLHSLTPSGLDNEQIDADLAAEYGDRHEAD